MFHRTDFGGLLVHCLLDHPRLNGDDYTPKSRFKMTSSTLKRGRVQRNNSPSKSPEAVGFSSLFI